MPRNVKKHVSPEQVLEVLETCYDPCCKERGVNIVELGLIQGVKVAENGRDVQVELLLTSGWCPFSTHLLEMIDQSLHGIDGVGEVDTEIVWNTVCAYGATSTPTTTPSRARSSGLSASYLTKGAHHSCWTTTPLYLTVCVMSSTLT